MFTTPNLIAFLNLMKVLKRCVNSLKHFQKDFMSFCPMRHYLQMNV